MNIKQLNARIDKKNKDIAKIQRRVDKWVKGLTAEEEQAAMSTWSELKDYFKSHTLGYERENQIEEYHRAISDMKDNVATLNKYKALLDIEVNKANATRIKPIVDFLQQWKEDVIDYIEYDVENAQEYYKYNSMYCDYHNSRYSYIKEIGEDTWKEKMKEIIKLEKHYKEITNPLTLEVYSPRYGINYTRLNEILDKEVESKYWNMINKVTEITGEIDDATALRIGGDGNLNGIIIGNKGKVRLETIRTSGENAGIIVNVKRGPIAHYRLLVNKIG